MRFFCSVFVFSVMPFAFAGAAEERYDICAALTQSDPQAAFDMASRWAWKGGGAAARHCRALARANLGDPRAAAEEIRTLAAEIDAPDSRGEAFAQAGLLFLEAAEAQSAEAAFSDAIRFAPGPGAYGGRARARAALENWAGAAADLDAAIAFAPADVELLALRAAARRKSGDFDAALGDAEAALRFNPNSATAAFERAATLLSLGRVEEAAKGFELAAALDPKGPIGAFSRANLLRMFTAGTKK